MMNRKAIEGFTRKSACLKPVNIDDGLVGRQGFEPWTNGLRVHCSTN